MWRRTMRTSVNLVKMFGWVLLAGQACWPASPLDDFAKRVEEYVNLHKKIESELPRLKPTDSPEAITGHQSELARRISEARPEAKPSEIFTPEISARFRRVVAAAMRGHRAKRIQQSLRHAEPVHWTLRVGDPYPANLPLQSTPPTLLLHLPKLPPEVDYRVAGHNLVLRDVGANLIVDFIPDAIP